MTIHIHPNTVMVFDLDDTLFKEIDFVRSGFNAVASTIAAPSEAGLLAKEMFEEFEKGSTDVFSFALERAHKTETSKEVLLELYRNHQPNIEMIKESQLFLDKVIQKEMKRGLLTDGRSHTQRNKLVALGLEEAFDPIIISEELGSTKPALQNYKAFETHHQATDYVYIGDNPSKDFVTPKKLKWMTICLRDDGRNIHPQNLKVAPEYQPAYFVDSLDELSLS